MAVPITICTFVVQWDEDCWEWRGMVAIPPREEDVLVTLGRTPEQALIAIVALARHVLLLQDGSAGMLDARSLIEGNEILLHDQRTAELFFAQKGFPHDTIECMRSLIKRMLPGTGPWQVLPPRNPYATDREPSYVVTTQRVQRGRTLAQR